MTERIIHELKTLPVYWDAIKRGQKLFEVRRDDRGFQKGDILELIRYKNQHIAYIINKDGTFEYNKRSYTIWARITYILTGGQFGIEPGYVVMQMELIDGEPE